MLNPRWLSISLLLAFSTMPGCKNSPSTPEPATPSPSTATAPKFVVQAKGSIDPTTLPGEAIRDVGPRLHYRPVKPRFDIKQTEAEMESILADGKTHKIMVLFDDALKVRVKKGEGKVRGKRNGFGLVAHNDREGKLEAINQILGKLDVSLIQPQSTEATLRSEDDLDAEEVRIEAEGGFDMPNRGSFANITIENLDKPGIKGLVKALQHVTGVKTVEITPYVKTAAVTYYQPPTDRYFPNGSNWRSLDYNNTEDLISNNPTQCWWWNRHSVGEAWSRTKGAGLKIAVIDNGFETSDTDGMPYDLANRRCFYETWFGAFDNDDVSWRSGVLAGTPNTHGTETAHLMSAGDNNTWGLTGVAPQTSIIPIKVGDSYWPGTGADNINRGIDYAVSKGAKVINISMTFDGLDNLEQNSDFRAAAVRAWFAGVTVVVAAGNAGHNMNYDPNIYSGIISVGSVDQNSYRWDGSNYGGRVDVAAAGANISAGSHENGAGVVRSPLFGTSYAAPITAGAAALIRTYTSNPAEVRDLLTGTADWAWGNDRRMDADLGGSDGINKVRVLNAGSAVRVAAAYDPANPFTVYMPASDDYALIYQPSTGAWLDSGWHPYNPMKNLAAGTTVATWTNNSGGPWAGSTSIFKNRQLWGNWVTGVSYNLKADGTELYGTRGNGDQTVGWVNGRQWTLN